MPLSDNIYAVRRATINRAQNKMIRAMLDSHMAALKNHIASAVECGSNEYGQSNQSGYDYATGLVADLRAHQELCRVFPPDDMWERSSI